MTWLNQNATIFNSLLVYQLQLCEIRLWHYLRILLTYWRWMKTRTVSAMMIRIRQKEVFWRSLKNYTCTESKKDLATFNLLISNMYSLAFLPFSVLILFLTLTFFLSWTLSVSSFFFYIFSCICCPTCILEVLSSGQVLAHTWLCCNDGF